MPYRYRCPRCRTTSRPYPTRAGALDHAHRHRQLSHAGDHPDGERIVHEPWQPQRGELVAIAALVVLLAVGLLHKYG